jgi:hypothetical protein
MSAFDYLNLLIKEKLLDTSFKQVSPIMYDESLLNKKVSVLIFQEDESKRLISKTKIIVTDITKKDMLPIFDVVYENVPMNLKYSS